ncbi:MAG: VOC family protein [Proteobacteria bacterium]|nr:VOC family protein [Pseudomonadota bacterium]
MTTLKPRLRHMGLYTNDMEGLLDFYTGILGMTETDRGNDDDGNPTIIFLSSDPSEHHEFVLASRDEMETVDVQQMSFLLDDLDQLREMHSKVVDAGITIDRMITHGNAWSIYFQDPIGNRIECYVHTPWYVPQPHAHPFDLSQSNAEIMAMTEAHCREDAGFMMAVDWEKKMAAKMGGGAA